MGRHFLITGGCGFIGRALVSALVKSQPESRIRVLDNQSVGTKEDLAENCSVIENSVDCIEDTKDQIIFIDGDIRDSKTCELAARGTNCIVHLAANTGVGPSVENPRADMETNVRGTFNLLEAARINKVAHFVFASSGAPAGAVTPPIHEEIAPHPVSPYGSSKLAGEGYCSSYYHTYGVNTVALRFGNVYGPGSKHKSSVVAKFIKQALNGEICEIYGDGNQTRDFIYIDDLIEAILKSSSVKIGGEVFQIASGFEMTLNELTQKISEKFMSITGKKINIKYGEKRIGDVQRNYSDTSKARKILGWEAITTHEQGIEKTINSFCN